MSWATLPKHAGRSEPKKLQGNWERSNRSLVLNALKETLLPDQNRTENLKRHSTSRRQQIRKSKPILVNVEVDGQNLSMELDTGASVSLISEKTYLSSWTDRERPPLHHTNKKLKTYTGELILLKGEIQVNVRTVANDATVQLPLLVVKRSGCSFLGRDWLNQLRFNWHKIFSVSSTKLEGMLEKHRAVFGDDLGEYKGPPTRIVVDPKEPPHFCKARSIPYALRDREDDQLKQLEADGIIQSVTHSEWAAPIVPSIKLNQSRRSRSVVILSRQRTKLLG